MRSLVWLALSLAALLTLAVAGRLLLPSPEPWSEGKPITEWTCEDVQKVATLIWEDPERPPLWHAYVAAVNAKRCDPEGELLQQLDGLRIDSITDRVKQNLGCRNSVVVQQCARRAQAISDQSTNLRMSTAPLPACTGEDFGATCSRRDLLQVLYRIQPREE